MLVQLNCIIVDADAANRTELATFLANHGLNVVGQLNDVSPLPTALARPDAAQLVIVNLDPSAQENLKRVGQLIKQFQNISFFVMSHAMDPNVLMEAMHLGVREFIPLPIIADKFVAGLERVATMHGMGKRARIINVIPTMGGCGSTTVACNVAASLTRYGKTVIVDLDLGKGAVASSFDIRPRYTIGDVMDSGEKLDPQLLDNALALHQHSGVAVLSRPEMPEESQRVGAPGLSRLLGVLGRMYDYVVIDSMMSVDPLYAAAIQAADLNLLVMQLNVPSAKNTERFVGALRRMGIDGTKISIVVNRFVKKGWDIAPEEVERSLGLKISFAIPNDFKNAITAINFGEPVVIRVPKAEMSLALGQLAETVCRSKAA